MTGWIHNLPQLSIAATILWKVTILLGVGWILHFLLLRRNPRWRVLLWRGVIVGALLLPVWEIVGPRLSVEVPPPQLIEAAGTDTPYPMERTFWPRISRPPVSTPISPVPSEPTLWERTKENLGVLLLAFWALVASVLTVRVFVVWKRVRAIIRSSSPAPEPVHRLLARIAEDLRCRRRAGVHTTEALSSPFLTGLLRVLIILPRRFLERGLVVELPAVLAHEVAHLRTNDLVWIFVAKCFGTLFWFHPLAWKIPSAHSGACEEVCDAVAAEYVGGTREYSGMLARFALELLADAPAHGGVPMILASRIMKRLHVLKRGINAAALAKRWVIPTVSTGLIILAGLGSLKLIYAEKQLKETEIESSVTDTDSRKETTVMLSSQVKREGNKVWIEGVPAVGWGQGRGCTYTGAFEAAASVTPNPWSYSDLMGVSGLAFRVRWCNNEEMGWCPSTPVGELPEEQILIDKATGWRQDTQVQFGDSDFDKAPIIRRIVESIDRGLPVLIYPPNYNMAVAYGYENEGDTLLVRDYMADFYEDKESMVLPADDLGPMQVYLEAGGDALPPRDRLIQGLQVAVRNWHREHGDGGVDGRDYWYGAAAYDQWIADLEKFESLDLNEEKAGQFFHLNWWNFTSLVDARNSVFFFLRENADVFGEEAREALLRAATIYEEETKFLDQAHGNKDAFLGPWSDNSIKNWTADVRRREREMLTKAKEMDAAAIAEIEKALASEGVGLSPATAGREGENVRKRDYSKLVYKGHIGQQDSFALTMQAVAKFFGKDIDYATLRFLSGNGFAPGIDVTEPCPGKWARRGSEHGLDIVAGTLGLKLTPLVFSSPPGWAGDWEKTRQGWAEHRKQCAPRLREALDSGALILTRGGWAWEPPEFPNVFCQWGVITEAREDGTILGAVADQGLDNPIGWVDLCWAIIPAEPSMTSEEARLAALRLGTTRIRGSGERFLPGLFLYGLPAMDRWTEQFTHVPFCDDDCGPRGPGCPLANSQDLYDGARCVASFLQEHVNSFPPEMRRDLAEAARRYERIAEIIEPFTVWEKGKGYEPIMGDLEKQKAHMRVIESCRKEMAAAGDALAKALATQGVELAAYRKPDPGKTITAEGWRDRTLPGGADLPKSAMLDGVPHGKGDSNSYARGLDIVLNYLGTKADYDTIMGDTGQAFIIMSEEGGPLIDGAVDVGWWPIAAWGIKLRLHFLAETVGRELRVVEHDPDAYHADPAAHYRTYFDSEVKRSIGARRPVLAQHAPCFVVTGYDENDPPLLGDCPLREEKQTNRMEGYPWGLIVPGKEMEPMDRKKADLDAIRHAVALGRDSVEMNVPAYWSEWLTVKGRFTGQRSFELWAQALRDTEHLGQARWHANMVHHLGINRTTAVDYLRAMAERHPENVAQHLKMAAGTYEKVLAEVGKADTSETAMTSKTGREKLAKLVERIADLEAQAVDHLAQVLEEYEIEPPVARGRGVTSTMNASDLRGRAKREGNKVFIEGFEQEFWGREPGTLNSVMYTYSLLMNHLGDESVTYDELMGVSGAAFRIQILEAEGDLVPGLWGPCPSSPHANCGFQCSTEARNAFGLEVAHYEAKDGDAQAERKRRAAIIQSIDRGIPVVYEKEENDLIVGYFPDDESKYLRRCYGAKKEGYVELTDWGWGYAEVLTQWGEPRPEGENHLNSLKLAVRLAYSARFKKYLSGFNAYQTWIAGLLDEEGYAKCDKDPMPWGNAWCFENLIDARAAAARYLRSIKGEYRENTAAHLEKAANLYEQISTTLAAWHKEAPDLWELNKKEKWTKEFRESEAEVLKMAMALERKAVAEIEKALLAEGMDVGAMHADAARVATDENPIGEGGNTMKKLEGLKWKPMWTTRIGCLKGCVDYLGVDASDSWLFGASGHAFALNIHEELCPSGPTAWADAVDRLAGNVGVQIENLGGHKSEPNFESTREEVWKKTCAAIDQGYPCLGWELDIPEYYVVKGYNDDSYIFTGPLDEEEGTKPWKELGDTGIGVVAMSIVRPSTAANDKKLVRDAFEYALEVSRNPQEWSPPQYKMGLAGYDVWIKALEERKIDGYGHSYNSQVWSECRRHAVGFLKEAKTRLDDEQLNPLFDQAIAHYEKVAENLTKVAEAYPIEGDDADHQMEDEEKRRTCLEALRTVRTEEEAGLGVLEQIVARLSDEE